MMDQDFSVRRLGPSLVLMWDSGATRLIALTKADLVEDASWFLREAAQEQVPVARADGVVEARDVPFGQLAAGHAYDRCARHVRTPT